MSFNPNRLSLARKCRGLSKRKLSILTNLSERTVAAHESGQTDPNAENLSSYSVVLQFPVSFFQGDDIDLIPASAASFRAFSKMTSGQRDMCLSDGAIVVELINGWLEQNFQLPTVDIPDLLYGDTDSPEAVAEKLRNYWGLGFSPIKNLMHLVESKGIKVFSLPKARRDADGFSFWHNNIKPFIFVDHNKTAERMRFDIAHELGHLILHRRESLDQKKGMADTKKLENEANEFGSSFLMPKNALISTAPRNPTIKSLITYKRYWNVSFLALVFRLNKLNLMSDWVYRSMCIGINQYGRDKEPQGLPHEESQILSKVFRALAEEKKTMADMADEIGLNPDHLSEYFFDMTIKPTRPLLRLVK